MVHKFRQRLGRGDLDTHRNTCASVNLRADLPAKALKITGHAGELSESLVAMLQTSEDGTIDSITVITRSDMSPYNS